MMLARQTGVARFASRSPRFTSAPALRIKTPIQKHLSFIKSNQSSGDWQSTHTVDEDLRDEAIVKFFNEDDIAAVKPTSGGVNNVVEYIELKDGKRYILRIYNNGNKSEKVVFEHHILNELAPQKLSFDIPRPLRSKNGRTHELLSSGTESCVFHIIPGTLAKTLSPYEVGRATGELNAAMGKVKLPDMKPPIAPYFELYAVHHALTEEKFFKEMETNKALDVCREPIDYLVSQMKGATDMINRYHSLGLPKQLIHGDLHYDNVMVLGDRVSGLLDFEFCSYDWRAMELAVSLSKYVGEDDPLPLCEEFATGFAEHGLLTDAEIDAMPDLINLRIFSNTAYFTGRAIAGEDTIEALTARAAAYAKRVQWVNANKEALCSRIRNKMNESKRAVAA